MSMKKFEKNVLITGGAGFIGSHVIRLFVKRLPLRLVTGLQRDLAGELNCSHTAWLLLVPGNMQWRLQGWQLQQ